MAMNYYFSFLIFRFFHAIGNMIYLVSINTLRILLRHWELLQIYRKTSYEDENENEKFGRKRKRKRKLCTKTKTKTKTRTSYENENFVRRRKRKQLRKVFERNY